MSYQPSYIPMRELSVNDAKAYNKVLASAFNYLSHPDSSVLLGHLRARNYRALLEWAESRHTDVTDATSYFVETQLVALIKKYPFTEAEIPGLNPEDTARSKFHAAEHRCMRVNQRRRAQRNRWDPAMSYWEMARSYIIGTIGYEPDLESIYAQCNFTGGASVGVHGNATNVVRKFLAPQWSCTPAALRYATKSLWDNTHARDVILADADSDETEFAYTRTGTICIDEEVFTSHVKTKVKFLSYNKITFVPKTASTHRTIAVEPLFNGWVQKGIDLELRRLLKRRGLDLSSQAENAEMARLGSMGSFNPYATLDLSMASDSLSIEVVRDLLPPAWFDLLNDCRSKYYTIDGSSPRRYHKFCSMGNGFCFPLETLIFAAFAYAASAVSSLTHAYDFRVYGDDIVVRQSSALLLTELLGLAGFKLNGDKSFIVGPFRESCGSDWVRGQDVRPVYISNRLSDVRELFALHNSTLRSPRTELALEEVREVLRSLAPRRFRFMRPGREPGDTCFSVPLDVAMRCPTVKWVQGQGKRFPWAKQRWSWTEISSEPVHDATPPWCEASKRAMYYSFMSGSSSDMLAMLRYSTRPRYRDVSRWYSESYHGGAEDWVPNPDIQAWLSYRGPLPYIRWQRLRSRRRDIFSG